jgi:hypothetical protein
VNEESTLLWLVVMCKKLEGWKFSDIKIIDMEFSYMIVLNFHNHITCTYSVLKYLSSKKMSNLYDKTWSKHIDVIFEA